MVSSETTVTTPELAPPGAAKENGAGMIDLLLILAARKKLILGWTVAIGLAASGVAFLLPDEYTGTALLMPPQQEQTATSAMLGQLAPLASVAGKDLGWKTPGDLYIGLLASRSIADHVIEKFALRSLYKAKTMVDARAKLRSKTRFTTGKDSLVRLEIDDIDPKRAAAMANCFVDALNAQNTGFGVTEAGQRRVFLEQQLKDEKDALTSAEAGMKQTQAQTGLIQIDTQTSLAIGSAAQLNAQIAAGEVTLQRLRMGATSENPEVMRVEAELGTMRQQLRKMESAPRTNAADPMLSTSSMPVAGLEYLRRLRDLKYHEFLFEMLSKQYEAARMDEVKAAPLIQVVDRAIPPDKKSGPHRGLIILFGLVAGCLVSSIGAYLSHGTSDPAIQGRIRLLRRQLSIRSNPGSALA